MSGKQAANPTVDAVRPVFAAREAARAPGMRREGDREVPVGPRAERTRSALLMAAGRLFAERGYQTTTVADIAESAGVSLGTFYQYFRDRSDVVAALLRIAVTTMLDRTDARWRAAEGRAGLSRVLANFVGAYAETAALSRVWEEVSHVDPDLAALRRDLGRVFTEAVETELIRAGRRGECRSFAPPAAALAARALAGMVDRFCYVTYVFDPPTAGPPSPDEAAAVLTDLWAAAIDLRG